MNSNQLLHILQQDTFTKTVFTDVLPSDRLPAKIRKPKGFILNTDPSNKPGTHWIAMFLATDGKGEFWDSYGKAPGFYSQAFTRFLEEHCKAYTWNKKVLQAYTSDVCGQYTLFFALHRCRGIPMSTIASMFTDNKDWNDMLVRDFIEKWYS